MPTGSDGDEELLLDELEPEPDVEGSGRPPSPPTPTGLPALPTAATASMSDAPAFEEAAAGDPRADAELFEAEAVAESDGGRRAALWLEVARLAESALGDDAATLRAARAAFAADPSFAAALGPLRHVLVARGLWDELVAAYDAVLEHASLAAEDRADLLVERGRALEDRLERAADARASYEAALAAAPDHAPALLALFINASRVPEGAALERALTGLARRAATPARRAALTATLARRSRARGGGAGAARALRVLLDMLRERTPDTPLVPLLAELDALSRATAEPAVAARALQELGHEGGLDAPWAAALLRERARLLREHVGDPRGALEALEGASRLAPGHALVAAELIDLAAEQDRFDVVERVVARFEAVAGRNGERAQVLALRQVAALGRGGRVAEALAALEATPGLRRAAGQPEVFGLRVALLARARDAHALADAFAAEGARAGGAAGARALVFAAAVRQWWADDAAGAEELYRRALAAAPAARAAWDALAALLAAQGRGAELADLLEAALGEIVGTSGSAERELTLREELVALYRDDLGAPEKAFAQQKQLVATVPRDVRQRVRLHDLELAGGIEASDVAEATAEEVESLRVLAAGADEPAVAAALKVEAARLLSAAGEEPKRRAAAARLLAEAAPDDPSGLGTALLEASRTAPADRAAVVARELESAVLDAPAEVVRALRFRLAHHHAAAGRFAEAVAALTPLRAEEDALARAWSWDIARRSRDAILEVAILSDEASGGRDVLGAPADVAVALGEALERAGDEEGAGAAFTRALARAPSVEAALGLLRVAAKTAAPEATRAALVGLEAACGAEPHLAAAAGREAALLRAASGLVDTSDLSVAAPTGASSIERAETAIVRWAAGVRRGDAGVLAGALFDMGEAMAATGGEGAAAAVPLLARASARARLAGRDVTETLHRRMWRVSHAPPVATLISDLPVTAGEGWPSDRPDPRRARATKVGGGLGLALDLEAALDAERRGALGGALGAYARVIAVAPDHLEAWEGIRRVARAGDDPLGEARALCRLGALARRPSLAGALFSQAARLFEQVGRWEEALALWGHALEAVPDDAAAFERLHTLLVGDLEAPGRLEALERVLTHRLAAAPRADDERVRLLLERALHRLERLGDAEAARQDFKRILNIDARHVESLWRLARLASEAGEPAAAAACLSRFVAAAPDDPRADDARMDLASAYEATHDRARAIETLRRAAALRPGDPIPLERLVDLHARLGEWRSAVEILRDWEEHQADPHDRAELQLRIGTLLRDVGRDATGAALAFRRAAELDPLGAAGRELVALHDAQNDSRGAVLTIEREITELRAALSREPLDAARLARLEEFLGELGLRAPSPVVAAAHAVVVGVQGLLEDGGEAPERGRGAAAARPLALRLGEGGSAFWSQLAYPGALGFRAEIWVNLVESASALFPPTAKAPPGRARRLDPATEPRLAWVFATAAACGIGGLRLYLSPAIPDANPALIIEEPEPALVVGMAALEPKAATRFFVGRALGMLRARAAVIDRVDPSALAPLFACAALTAGAGLPAGLSRPDDVTERIVGKTMSRRDRKALVLQASRFGFESIDPARWGHAVRRTADRLGLVLAGDVAAAARAAARTDPARWKSAVRKTADRLATMLSGEGAAAAPQEAAPLGALDELRNSARALDLLRFALGDVYPALRREAEEEGEGRR
ncbi:MAG TPA: tetratricopeptide repeat protein [Polyangia bacterium]|jgi:tetratricopeptide (TPR) repeat protein|nr:tetratricopeptide repeat protein [Polyangia bacterium]